MTGADGHVDVRRRSLSSTADGRRVTPMTLLIVAPWLVLAAIPTIAVISAVRKRWTPVSDWAMIGAWSWDSLTWPPPLVGMPTSLSRETSEVVSHPGPLLFWALAIPTHLFGPPGYGLIIGATLINLMFLGLIARALYVIGGTWLSFVGAVAVGLLMMGLGADAWRDPYNPVIAILPMLAALLAAWAVVLGRNRWLIALVFAGSFAAQAHTSYLLVVAALVVIVGVHLATGVFADEKDRAANRPDAKVLVTSLVVGLACWSGPIFDQLFRSGNLWNLAVGGTGTETTVGLRYGFDRLIDAVSIPAWWWTGVPSGALGHPSALHMATGIFVLLLAVGLLVCAWPRDRRVAGSLTIALTLAVVGVLTTSLMPADPFSTIVWNNRYVWLPISLFLWLTIAHAAAVLFAVPAFQRRGLHDRVPLAPVAAVMTALMMVIAVSSMSDIGSKHESGSVFYGPTRQHAQTVDGLDAPNGFLVMIDSDELPNAFMLQGLVGQLIISGVQVTIPVDLEPFGIFPSYQKRHAPTGREDAVLLVRSGAAVEDPPAGFCEISRYDPWHPWPVYEGYDGSLMYTGYEPSAIFLGPTDDSPAARSVVEDLCTQAASG